MHSVREFVEAALGHIDREVIWKGEGVDEVGLCRGTGEVLVAVDRNFFRPAEVDLLVGDASKAKQKLGWTHQKDFTQLVADMVRADVDRQARIGRGQVTLEDFL